MAKRKTKMLVKPAYDHLNEVPNVIKVRNNVPLPQPRHLNTTKYGFISTLKVGESFVVDTTTRNFHPKSLAPAAYQIASNIRHDTDAKFTVSVRTLEGTSGNPTKVGCWRIA